MGHYFVGDTAEHLVVGFSEIMAVYLWEFSI